MTDSRRLKRVELTPYELINLLRTDNVTITSDGIPSMANPVRVYVQPDRDVITLIVEDESFDPVEQGSTIPRLDCEVEIRECQTKWTT